MSSRLVIKQTRAALARPKYRPIAHHPCWVVILTGQGLEKRTADDDEEVVSRAPRVYGPATLAECQTYCNVQLLEAMGFGKKCDAMMGG